MLAATKNRTTCPSRAGNLCGAVVGYGAHLVRSIREFTSLLPRQQLVLLLLQLLQALQPSWKQQRVRHG